MEDKFLCPVCGGSKGLRYAADLRQWVCTSCGNILS